MGGGGGGNAGGGGGNAGGGVYDHSMCVRMPKSWCACGGEWVPGGGRAESEGTSQDDVPKSTSLPPSLLVVCGIGAKSERGLACG